MSSYYPLFLNMEGKSCVVVGGGEVAERKVRSLLDHGALVNVISASVTSGLAQLEKDSAIKITSRNYRPGDLEGAVIAIAATDVPETNGQVAAEGRQRGVLTNVVDTPEQSDFIVPSLIRRGDISIAISTSGKSPALSRKLRTELENVVTKEYASLVELISNVRQELTNKGIHIDGSAWQKSLDLQYLLDMIKNNKLDDAREHLLSQLTGEPQEGQGA